MRDADTLKAKAEALGQFVPPEYGALPEIDLYMDQVIGYLNKLLCSVCRSDDGAPLTPSMINNYVKGGYVARPVQKKYSRDRIAMLYMLCCVKQNLTISEAAALLGDSDTEQLYARFRALQAETLQSAVRDADLTESKDESELRMTALRLVLHSAAERLLAEEIIARLTTSEEPSDAAKKQKKQNKE